MRQSRLWASAALTLCGFLGMRPASCQIFEVSAGASTSYGAEGAAVTIEGKNSETSLGGGFLHGQFAAGGSTSRPYAGGVMTAGQEDFRMDLPTDVFDSSHILYGMGIGFKSLPNASQSLQLFAGFESQEGGTPIFHTSSIEQAALYGQWSRPWHGSCSWTLTGLVSTESAAITSVSCRHTAALHYSFSAGFGGGSPYAAGSLVLSRRRLKVKAAYLYTGEKFQRANNIYQPVPEPTKENASVEYNLSESFSVSGAHGNYQTPYDSQTESSGYVAPVLSSLDTASLEYQHLSTGAGISILHSSATQPEASLLNGAAAGNSAITLNFRTSLGRVLWKESLLHSYSSGGTNSTLWMNGVGFNVNPHLRLTESVNFSGSGPTFSHGGALITGFSSFEVDYQVFYLVTRPQQPFEQAMVFDAQVRLPKALALHASSTVDSTGRTLYTFQIATTFDRERRLPDPISAGGLGANLLEGRVVDPQGKAVEGAVLLIGEERVYTDAEGAFSFRERRPRVHDFHVLTEEFLGVGNYVARSAPTRVKTSKKPGPTLIVVERVAAPAMQSGPANLQPSAGAKVDGGKSK